MKDDFEQGEGLIGFKDPTHAIIELQNGKQYNWHSRAHRKLRYMKAVVKKGIVDSPKKQCLPTIKLPHFLSWEPKIITWWNIWIGFIANTLWIINGIYLTFPPSGTSTTEVTNITFATGCVGAFMFIMTGYMGVVETINHRHNAIVEPPSDDREQQQYSKRTWSRTPQLYGAHVHPLNHQPNNETSCATILYQHDADDNDNDDGNTNDKKHIHRRINSKKYERKRFLKLRQEGYPLVVVHEETKPLQKNPTISKESTMVDTTMNSSMIGDHIDIIWGDQVIQARVEGQQQLALRSKYNSHDNNNKTQQYIWWTWHPHFQHHIALVNAYLFLVCTCLFFIPACLSLSKLSFGSELVFMYIFQIVPSVGFIICGYSTMAESVGTYNPVIMLFGTYNTNTTHGKSHHRYVIGFWVGVFNTLGGLGFLVCPILSLPGYVCDENENCDTNFNELTTWGGDFSSFWGSCFFWVAGVLECIEFADNRPCNWPCKKITN